MQLTLTFDQLLRLMQEAGESAIMAYKRDNEPLSDLINQADAKRWIAANGFKPVMLKKWVDAGVVAKSKAADAAQNAQAFYSKAELKRVMCAAKLSV